MGSIDWQGDGHRHPAPPSADSNVVQGGRSTPASAIRGPCAAIRRLILREVAPTFRTSRATTPTQLLVAVVISNLAFLVLQRKEFDPLVAGHPGLGMGPPGDLVAVDVVIHQEQRQPQRPRRAAGSAGKLSRVFGGIYDQRRRPDSNRGMTALQAVALPLGYGAGEPILSGGFRPRQARFAVRFPYIPGRALLLAPLVTPLKDDPAPLKPGDPIR
jgi:hypothetical protein